MRIVATLALLVLPFIASAHHSRAHFSDEISELEGELVEIVWRNPHPGFTLRTVGDDGQEELWTMEAAALYSLRRGGVTADLFTVGDLVRVAGQKSLYEARDLVVTNMLLPSGREVITLPSAAPRWDTELIGGRDQWIADDDRLRPASGENQSIFKVWTMTKADSRVSHLPFTAAAIAARAGWNPVDNVIMDCEQPGMPIVMWPSHPHEFIDQGDVILLRVETWDTLRTIHMDGAEAAEVPPRTRLGYSAGYWEDRTLVVETKRISWPYFDSIGTPQSDAVEIVERFIVSEDGRRLDLHMTITDSATFIETATFEAYRLALGETLTPYDCQVD
jgi:hypothetical protein